MDHIVKLDLSDTTFMIPVKFDSEDRIINLNIVAMYLRKYLDTNIIIAEQGREPKVPDIIGKMLYNTYIFYKTDNDGFHKSKLVNAMIKQATTPIVAMHDSDVLAFPEEYMNACNKLRGETAELAYPFNGRVINIQKKYVNGILETLKMDFVQKNRFTNLKDLAPGGCVIYNRDKFIKAGMMNEHFISYGPEDAEQLLRLQKLGYRFTRANRPLYHLDHSRTAHSGDKHRYAQSNWDEFRKIKTMNQKMLRDYIASWSWAKDI